MSLIDQAQMYWHFAWDLKKYLKDPITLEQSRRVIENRLTNKSNNLLTIAQKTIYENIGGNSPYLPMLKMAGCEYGDLERMVLSDGIEAALGKLSDAGVYISIEEFKGRKEIVRGNHKFHVKTSDFDNPFSSNHLETSSSGSRSAGTRTMYDFDYITANWTMYILPMVDACDAQGAPYALWYPIMPGAGPAIVLSFTKGQIVPIKWFSPVDRSGFKQSLKNRLGTNYIVYMGRLLGAKLPTPEYVPLDEAWIVAQWLSDAEKNHGSCIIETYVSSAVRICQAASERKLNIAGTKFLVNGEPLTEAKRKEIEKTGATVCSIYGFVEAGFVGVSCFGENAGADDVHLFEDSFALIQHSREVPHAGVSVDAFLFTTLLPAAPKILLNVESGDYGLIETRTCGCKFEKLGFTKHISNIRGFDKLTSSGMTFVGTEIVRIIEEVLPAKFGGSSTDYQMIEEEDDKSLTKMSLIVNPTVGKVDEAKLIKTVIFELGKGNDAQRMMAEVWSKSQTVRIKREKPYTTARGKLMPLQMRK